MAIKDTHKAVKDLIEAGFTEKQAEAITSIVIESVTRKLSTSDFCFLGVILLLFLGLIFNMFASYPFRK